MSKKVQKEVAEHIDIAAGKRKRVVRRNAFEWAEREQVRIHEISRSPSSFLPAKKKRLRTDQQTDQPTYRPINGRTNRWTDTPSYRVMAHD